jgi:hypothetical protein
MSRQELTRRASRRSIATARSGFAFQRDWIAEWGDFLLAPEELIDLGEGGVFVSGVGVTRADRRQLPHERSWLRQLLGRPAERRFTRRDDAGLGIR